MNYIINGSLILLLLIIFYLTTKNIIDYKKYGNELLVPIPMGILSIIIFIASNLILGLFRNNDNIYYYIIRFIVISIISFFVYTIYFYSYYQNSCKTSGFFQNAVYLVIWIILLYLFKFFRIELKFKYVSYAICIFLIICLAIYSNSKFLNIPLLILVLYIFYLIITFMSDSILYILSYFSKIKSLNLRKFLPKNPFISNNPIPSAPFENNNIPIPPTID